MGLGAVGAPPCRPPPPIGERTLSVGLCKPALVETLPRCVPREPS
jgi:hypothetical protein